MFGCFCYGGDEEDRTLDLTDANRTLSQLSYAPNERYYTTRYLICLHQISKKSPHII